jgi:hypothetical protein
MMGPSRHPDCLSIKFQGGSKLIVTHAQVASWIDRSTDFLMTLQRLDRRMGDVSLAP